MDNTKNNNTNEELFEAETVTLLDEDNNEIEFEVIGGCVVDGVQYFALIPAGSADEDGGFTEYIILKSVKDDAGEDDAEFDRVAATFDDAFDAEYDYDAE